MGYRHFGNRHQRFGADRKIDPIATEPTIAEGAGKGSGIGAGLGGAAGLSFKGPLHRRFQRTGSRRFIRDLVRDDGKARQSGRTECR
jgi:hypothetical protein